MDSVVESYIPKAMMSAWFIRAWKASPHHLPLYRSILERLTHDSWEKLAEMQQVLEAWAQCSVDSPLLILALERNTELAAYYLELESKYRGPKHEAVIRQCVAQVAGIAMRLETETTDEQMRLQHRHRLLACYFALQQYEAAAAQAKAIPAPIDPYLIIASGRKKPLHQILSSLFEKNLIEKPLASSTPVPPSPENAPRAPVLPAARPNWLEDF